MRFDTIEKRQQAIEFMESFASDQGFDLVIKPHDTPLGFEIAVYEVSPEIYQQLLALACIAGSDYDELPSTEAISTVSFWALDSYQRLVEQAPEAMKPLYAAYTRELCLNMKRSLGLPEDWE